MSETMKPRDRHEPFQCPFCSGEDLRTGLKIKRGYREIHEEIRCENCGKDFDAIYVFSHFNPAE